MIYGTCSLWGGSRSFRSAKFIAQVYTFLSLSPPRGGAPKAHAAAVAMAKGKKPAGKTKQTNLAANNIFPLLKKTSVAVGKYLDVPGSAAPEVDAHRDGGHYARWGEEATQVLGRHAGVHLGTRQVPGGAGPSGTAPEGAAQAGQVEDSDDRMEDLQPDTPS